MLPANRVLIHVVPQLKPMRCGVSDHAISLARELKTSFGIDGAFVVLNSDEKCNLSFPVVHCAPSELLENCVTLSSGRAAAILVHLSGYGYAADGAPTQLAKALRNVRASGRFHTAVYFHELIAGGMPWKSGFWHSRRQKREVCRIAEGCDLLVTSIGYFGDWLERETTRQTSAPIELLSVFSSSGESLASTPIAERAPAIAVFGLAASRRRAYKELSSLAGLLDSLGVKEILDIGPEFDAPATLNGVPVRRRGTLELDELASQLARTMFGFVTYNSPYLARSSVFAGYCGHGTIPVITKSFPGAVDGLEDGLHVLSPRTAKTVVAGDLQHCSNAAWSWYQGHRLHVHAATYARWMEQSGPKASEEMSRTAGAKELQAARLPLERTRE